MQGSRGISKPAFWRKQIHQWHWISSAICLTGMLFFAITGITLNHASWIGATPQTEKKAAVLPPELLDQVSALPEEGRFPLPAPLAAWAGSTLGASMRGGSTEYSANEVYVSLPRPGGDAWLSIDRADGTVQYEKTDRGWLSWLNDLHKGRNTGIAWIILLDLFSIACVVFCVTGFLLLKLHSVKRPLTWPTVTIGILLPFVLAAFFIH